MAYAKDGGGGNSVHGGGHADSGSNSGPGSANCGRGGRSDGVAEGAHRSGTENAAQHAARDMSERAARER
jgi:hypothetical protein